ncbi:hypothetical protein MFUL124B02_23340 [Myxococcus fulvus 124B02]|nr:hypothetical protein MFUL124B02_23340 [Myxococcus fulvus 124B02]
MRYDGGVHAQRLLTLPSLLALLSLSACDSSDAAPGGCGQFSFPLSTQTSSGHLAACDSAACGNGENPPNSGPHCASVARCGIYDEPVSRCLYVHNLEHGHAVFLYNCPDGCPDEVAKLEAAAATVPIGANGVRRALIAQDPRLPNRVAAMLWRRTYLADAADPEALRCLLAFQDTDAPEPGLACPGP